MDAAEIVQKLWSLCHVLRDEGVTYHQYLTELTYLLFLKMAKETGADKQLPKGYCWGDVVARGGNEGLTFYRALLVHLGTKASGRVRAIYAGASTSLKRARTLQRLVEQIDRLDWYSARTEGLGAMYEGLLEKNANEKRSGAGQYFTPRPLVDSIVKLVKPRPGERVQDPAAGTGGF
jgi:type I restriction enzyme M protein